MAGWTGLWLTRPLTAGSREMSSSECPETGCEA